MQTSGIAIGRVSPQTYRWVVLGAAVTAQATASVVILGVTALLPFFRAAFDLSPASVALAVSAVNAGPILSMLFIGAAIDRYGERIVVTVTMVAMGATALVAAAIDPAYGVWLVLLGFVGAWYGSVQPGGTRAIVRWFPANLRGIAIGVRQAGLPLGGALAAATLPLVAVHAGWLAAVTAQGIVGIAGGLLFGAFYRDNNPQFVETARVDPPKTPELVRMLVKDRSVRPVLISGIAMVTLQYTFLAHVALFLITELKVPLLVAELLLAVVQITGIVGRIVLTWISDFFWPQKRLRSLLWTMLACAAALLLFAALPAHPPLWVLVAICVWIGFFGIGWYTLFLIQVAELAPTSAVASTVSFALTLNQIAIVVMPPSLGLLVGLAGGYQVGWAALALVLLLAAGYLWWTALPRATLKGPTLRCAHVTYEKKSVRSR